MTPAHEDTPSAPERAPGGGRDMPRKDYMPDEWLPAEPDKELLALIARLEARTDNVIVDRGGRPGNETGPDTDCREAARWLRHFMGEKR